VLEAYCSSQQQQFGPPKKSDLENHTFNHITGDTSSLDCPNSDIIDQKKREFHSITELSFLPIGNYAVRKKRV
jgi:hypothetical protein